MLTNTDLDTPNLRVRSLSNGETGVVVKVVVAWGMHRICFVRWDDLPGELIASVHHLEKEDA